MAQPIFVRVKIVNPSRPSSRIGMIPCYEEEDEGEEFVAPIKKSLSARITHAPAKPIFLKDQVYNFVQSHCYVHTKNGIYRCEIGVKGKIEAGEFIEYLQQTEKGFYCEECDRMYKNAKELYVHTFEHLQLPPFVHKQVIKDCLS